jgi:hypothetical protein
MTAQAKPEFSFILTIFLNDKELVSESTYCSLVAFSRTEKRIA